MRPFERARTTRQQDYEEFAAQVVTDLRPTFPRVALRSSGEMLGFVGPLIPKLVHKYILFAGTMKNCSGASADFAEIATQAGFPTLVRLVPRHQYNVVLTADGPYKVDLTAIQFLCKHDLHTDDPEELAETLENYRQLRLAPDNAVVIERLPIGAFSDVRMPVGQYSSTWPDPAKALSKYDPRKTEEFFPELFRRYG